MGRHGVGVTHQATVSILAAEIGLCARRTLADLCHLIGTVGCRGASAKAEDETAGLDEGRVEVWGVQRYELEGAIGIWQGRSQFAIVTASKRGMLACASSEIFGGWSGAHTST